MTYHIEATAILEKCATLLDKLAQEIPEAEDARLAAAKLHKAALRLMVEPLRPEDIKDARALYFEAKPSLETLEAKVREKPYRPLLWVALDGWNATQHLLSGLDSLHTGVEIKDVAPQKRLWSILPTSWWGGL